MGEGRTEFGILKAETGEAGQNSTLCGSLQTTKRKEHQRKDGN